MTLGLQMLLETELVVGADLADQVLAGSADESRVEGGDETGTS